MLKNEFLRHIYKYQVQLGAEEVLSTDIEEELKVPYQRVETLSSYWEEIGAITRFSKRGGYGSSYRLTDKGVTLAYQLTKKTKHQKKFIIIIAAIALISGIVAAVLLGTTP